MIANKHLSLSGDRIRATYQLSCPDDEVEPRAQAIAVEQTVEFPYDLLPSGDIPEQIVGHVEQVQRLAAASHAVEISYAVECAGAELTQLFNLLFGNVSLQPGVRLLDFELPFGLLEHFRGPRFGATGLRTLLGRPDRPLLCSALKPMGLSADELASIAYDLAMGGVDMIKDDHGIADQRFAGFERRVRLCTEAVQRANAQTGGCTRYLPNISGSADGTFGRARFAADVGAGGVLVAPGLVGFDTMRTLADDDSLALPIMAHPALLGSFVVSPTAGIAHGALFGKIMRLAGADTVIFPNHGGRFSFSPAQCRSIAEGCRAELGGLAPALPTPAGGMTLAAVGSMIDFYGAAVVLLIGGDLHRGAEGLRARVARVVALAGETRGADG